MLLLDILPNVESRKRSRCTRSDLVDLCALSTIHHSVSGLQQGQISIFHGMAFKDFAMLYLSTSHTLASCTRETTRSGHRCYRANIEERFLFVLGDGSTLKPGCESISPKSAANGSPILFSTNLDSILDIKRCVNGPSFHTISKSSLIMHFSTILPILFAVSSASAAVLHDKRDPPALTFACQDGFTLYCCSKGVGAGPTGVCLDSEAPTRKNQNAKIGTCRKEKGFGGCCPVAMDVRDDRLSTVYVNVC